MSRWGVPLASLVATLAVTPVLARTTQPALEPGWLVDRWSRQDGLPLDHVRAVAQTPDGFLWLATYDGLVRFDGHTFVVHRRSDTPGLTANRFYALAVDSEGDLWAAGETAQLARLHAGRFTSWQPPPGGGTADFRLGSHFGRVSVLHERAWRIVGGTPQPAPATEGRLLAASSEADGTLWVKTDLGVLVRLGADGSETRFPLPLGAHEAPFGRPFATAAHGTWLTSAHGLYRFQGDGVVLVAGVDGPVDEPFCEIFERAGGLLARSERGWWRWDGAHLVEATAGLLSGPTAPIECRLTAGQSAFGEHVWEVAGRALYRDGVRLVALDKDVYHLFIDRDDALWVATIGAGLLRIRPATVRTLGTADGLVGSNVQSVTADASGDLWISNVDTGLQEVHGGRVRSFSLEPRPGGPGPQAVVYYAVVGRSARLPGPQAPRGEERVWAPSNDGLCEIAGDRCVPLVPFVGPEWGTGPGFLDSHGATWLATDAHGLGRIQEVGGAWRWSSAPEGASLTSHVVRSFAEAPDGSVLLGTTERGLVRYPHAGGPPTRVTRAQGLSSDALRGLWVDSAGFVWAGTDDGGLCRVDLSQETAVCLGGGHGLPDAIHTVVEDGRGRLWLSSNDGLIVTRRSAIEEAMAGGPPPLALTLDETDGMANREANGFLQPAAARDRAGTLWFATQKGLAGVQPEAFDAPVPSVTVDSITIEGAAGTRRVAGAGLEGSTGLTGLLALSAAETRVIVQFTSPLLGWADDLRFRYRLVGIDGAWHIAGPDRSARLLNLPPGELRLEAQAGLLEWGAPTSVRLSRAPALSESPWFWSVCGLLAIALGLGVGQLRTVRLRRRAEVLERLVVARTTDLAARNQEMDAQSQRLLALTEVKNRFLANVSHELRTPLMLITGPLADLSAALGGREGARLEVIRRNAERLGTLVEQLLDIARLESGDLPFRARRLDLPGFLRRVAERFGAQAEHTGTRLLVSVGTESVAVYFDPDLIDKVVSNLLANALKFVGRQPTQKNEVRLSLTPAGPDALGERVVTVTVEDTGQGIPVDERERVFERFHQVETGATRRYEGAGLGLALARELVSMHGGRIWADSGAEGGARLSFTLPLGASHLAPDDIYVGALPLEGAPEPGTSPNEGHAEAQETAVPAESSLPQVLVVEDHPDMRAYLVEHLASIAQVREACDGESALTALRTDGPRPRVVVTDAMMPGMDGLALCRAIRAAPELALVRLLVVSARAAPSDRVAGLEAADDYLAKPFRVEELLARVRNLLRANGPGDAMPAAPGFPDALSSKSAPAPGPAAEPEAVRQFLERVRAAALDRLTDEGFDVAALAAATGLSPRQLQRRLRDATGQAPLDFVRTMRLETAQDLLRRRRFATVAEVAAAVGLSPSYFSRLYTAWAGHPPSEDLLTGSTPQGR